MRMFMTNLMKQQWGEQVEDPIRSEPLPVIDMVDDASEHSKFSYLTGDCALSNVQVVMAPELSTIVPQTKAPACKEAVVTPKKH